MPETRRFMELCFRNSWKSLPGSRSQEERDSGLKTFLEEWKKLVCEAHAPTTTDSIKATEIDSLAEEQQAEAEPGWAPLRNNGIDNLNRAVEVVQTAA
jgi:hypothetical protein